MDIQEMVDARIEELRAQRRVKNPTPVWTPAADNDPVSDYHDELIKLGDLADKVFAGIAGRVLEIAERLSRDCARLEKDILHTRLMLLENAESVLDQALSIRLQVRKTIDGVENAHRQCANSRNAGLTPGGVQDLQPARPRKRANMVANGVSDLFRNTHR